MFRDGPPGGQNTSTSDLLPTSDFGTKAMNSFWNLIEKATIPVGRDSRFPLSASKPINTATSRLNVNKGAIGASQYDDRHNTGGITFAEGVGGIVGLNWPLPGHSVNSREMLNSSHSSVKQPPVSNMRSSVSGLDRDGRYRNGGTDGCDPTSAINDSTDVASYIAFLEKERLELIEKEQRLNELLELKKLIETQKDDDIEILRRHLDESEKGREEMMSSIASPNLDAYFRRRSDAGSEHSGGQSSTQNVGAPSGSLYAYLGLRNNAEPTEGEVLAVLRQKDNLIESLTQAVGACKEKTSQLIAEKNHLQKSFDEDKGEWRRTLYDKNDWISSLDQQLEIAMQTKQRLEANFSTLSKERHIKEREHDELVVKLNERVNMFERDASNMRVNMHNKDMIIEKLVVLLDSFQMSCRIFEALEVQFTAAAPIRVPVNLTIHTCSSGIATMTVSRPAGQEVIDLSVLALLECLAMDFRTSTMTTGLLSSVVAYEGGSKTSGTTPPPDGERQQASGGSSWLRFFNPFLPNNKTPDNWCAQRRSVMSRDHNDYYSSMTALRLTTRKSAVYIFDLKTHQMMEECLQALQSIAQATVKKLIQDEEVVTAECADELLHFFMGGNNNSISEPHSTDGLANAGIIATSANPTFSGLNLHTGLSQQTLAERLYACDTLPRPYIGNQGLPNLRSVSPIPEFLVNQDTQYQSGYVQGNSQRTTPSISSKVMVRAATSGAAHTDGNYDYSRFQKDDFLNSFDQANSQFGGMSDGHRDYREKQISRRLDRLSEAKSQELNKQLVSNSLRYRNLFDSLGKQQTEEKLSPYDSSQRYDDVWQTLSRSHLDRPIRQNAVKVNYLNPSAAGCIDAQHQRNEVFDDSPREQERGKTKRSEMLKKGTVDYRKRVEDDLSEVSSPGDKQPMSRSNHRDHIRGLSRRNREFEYRSSNLHKDRNVNGKEIVGVSSRTPSTEALKLQSKYADNEFEDFRNPHVAGQQSTDRIGFMTNGTRQRGADRNRWQVLTHDLKMMRSRRLISSNVNSRVGKNLKDNRLKVNNSDECTSNDLSDTNQNSAQASKEKYNHAASRCGSTNNRSSRRVRKVQKSLTRELDRECDQRQRAGTTKSLVASNCSRKKSYGEDEKHTKDVKTPLSLDKAEYHNCKSTIYAEGEHMDLSSDVETQGKKIQARKRGLSRHEISINKPSIKDRKYIGEIAGEEYDTVINAEIIDFSKAAQPVVEFFSPPSNCVEQFKLSKVSTKSELANTNSGYSEDETHRNESKDY